MKSLTSKLVTVAALVAAAGIASAQTMEANIPFSFHAGGKTFAAGAYSVRLNDRGNPVLAIQGDAGQRTFALTYRDGAAKTAWKNPTLTFRCSEGACALTKLWMGAASDPVYTIPAPRLRKDAPVTTAEVMLHPIKAD